MNPCGCAPSVKLSTGSRLPEGGDRVRPPPAASWRVKPTRIRKQASLPWVGHGGLFRDCLPPDPALPLRPAERPRRPVRAWWNW